NAYKVRSYLAAINAIRNAQQPITSGKDAAKLKGVGPGIAERVDIFLQGKDYGPEHEAAARRKLELNRALASIPGVGPRTADKLIAAGVTSLHDLRHPEHFSRLSPIQRIGLVYAKPLSEPVTRAKAELVADFIRDHISSNFTVDLMGAYRRGLDSFTTVSILLTHPHFVHIPLPARPSTPKRGPGSIPLPFYERATAPADSMLILDAVRPLEDVGLLAATITSCTGRHVGIAAQPRRGPDGQWTSMGERLRDIRYRRGAFLRLEINLAPHKARPAAMLALTGDEDFYHAARLAAHRQGLYLNEYGLWRWTPASVSAALSEASTSTDPSPLSDASPRQQEIDIDPSLAETLPSSPTAPGTWQLLDTPTEQSLLSSLALGHVPPDRRNFVFLRPR
ncbi:hypothetical protein K488DRAFT_36065, partial [Vararia minispora EC-137]